MDLFSPRHIGLRLLDISWVNKNVTVYLLGVFHLYISKEQTIMVDIQTKKT